MKKKLTKKLAVGMTVVGLGAVGTQTLQQAVQPFVYANTQSDQEIIDHLKQKRDSVVEQFNTIYTWGKEYVLQRFNELFPEFDNNIELLAKQSEILEYLQYKESLINRFKAVEEFVSKNNSDDNVVLLREAHSFVHNEILYNRGIGNQPVYPRSLNYREYSRYDIVGVNSNSNPLTVLENKIHGTIATETDYANAQKTLEDKRDELRNSLHLVDFLGADDVWGAGTYYGNNDSLLNKEIRIVENLSSEILKNAVNEKIAEWQSALKYLEPISQLLTRMEKVVKRSGTESIKPFYVNGSYNWYWNLAKATTIKSDQVIAELKPIQLDQQFYDLLVQIVNETDPTKNQALQAQAVAMIQFHEDKLNATIETVNRYNQLIDKIMEDPSQSRTLYAKLVFTDYSKYGHFYNAIHLPKATTSQEVAEAKNDILSVLEQFEKEHFGTSSTTSEDKVERLIDKANALIIKSGGTLYDIIQDETPFHDGKSPMVAWDTRIQSSQVKAEVRIVKFNQRFEDILAKMTQETDPAVISQLEKEANDILAFEEARLNATTETVAKYNAIMDKLNALPEKERHTAYFKLVFTDFGRYGHIYNAIHLPNVRTLAVLPKAKEEILAVLSGFEKKYFGTDTPVNVRPDETTTSQSETTTQTETSTGQSAETSRESVRPQSEKVEPLFQDEKPALDPALLTGDTSIESTQSQVQSVNPNGQESTVTRSQETILETNQESVVSTTADGVQSQNIESSNKTEAARVTQRHTQSKILPKTGEETSILGVLGYVMMSALTLLGLAKKDKK